jgi:hypothetical protein
MALFRSEVAKARIDLLKELLAFLENAAEGPESPLAYMPIVEINLSYWMCNLGLIQDPRDREILAEIEEKAHQKISLREEEVPPSPRINPPGSEDGSPEQKKAELALKEAREKAKRIRKAMDGNIEITNLYHPDTHREFSEKLYGYAQNRYMPPPVRSALEQLLKDIDHNLVTVLPQVLKDVFLEVFEYYKNQEGPEEIEISLPGVYDSFTEKAIRHDKQLEKLRELIPNHIKMYHVTGTQGAA